MIYFHFHYFVIADKSPSHIFFQGGGSICPQSSTSPGGRQSNKHQGGGSTLFSVFHHLTRGVGEGGWGKRGSGMGGDHECSRHCHELHLSLLDFVADCVSTPHMAQAISDVVG